MSHPQYNFSLAVSKAVPHLMQIKYQQSSDWFTEPFLTGEHQ